MTRAHPLFGACALAAGLLASERGLAQALAIISVSATGDHICVVRDDGAAFCWNANRYGQLGNGSTATQGWVPVRVTGDHRFASVSVGWSHTCGLTADGIAYCWGANYNGQLGHGPADSAPHPTPEPVAGGLRFASVSAGQYDTCATTSDGVAYCWGLDDVRLGSPGKDTCGHTTTGYPVKCSVTPAPVSGGLRFRSVVPGGSHACGVGQDLGVYCWGSNDNGALGYATPMPTSGTPGRPRFRSAVQFAAVSAGGAHTCGVASSGTVYCWGRNNGGQLGDGTTRDRSFPAPVAGGVTFSVVSAASDHTCGVATTGTAYCWGSNRRGQLGTGDSVPALTPTPVAKGVTFRVVSAGDPVTCGIGADGQAYCWGPGFASRPVPIPRE